MNIKIQLNQTNIKLWFSDQSNSNSNVMKLHAINNAFLSLLCLSTLKHSQFANQYIMDTQHNDGYTFG